ncbi:MAG: hypothetical protein AAB954_02120 [Patescibacteria group bacterium]
MEASIENVPSSEINTFEERSRVLVGKLGLTDGISNLDKVLETSKGIIEKYKIPESVYDDEVNLALILGCSQKLTEATDPMYLKRPESLIKRLVSPSIEKGIIDEEELWGQGPERAGLNEADIKEYVKSKIDIEATAQFIELHKESFNEARKRWKEKGFDLEIGVTIVGDDVYEFRQKTRSGGFINVPSKGELPKEGGPAKVEFVLLKGYSDKENFVRHELYHIEDYWGFIRRGYQESVLESLDELHTEYSAGNYNEDHSKDPFGDSSYFTLKQYWDKLSYVGDLDFNLIKDRSATIETIAKNFGLDGLVDFALKYAHGNGRSSIFETFYDYEDRPILDILVSKEKLNLRKLRVSGGSEDVMQEAMQSLDRLKKYTTPSKEGWYPKYKSVYELIPSKEGKVWSADNIELTNDDAKQMLIAYARALALTELCYQGEIRGEEVLYNKTIEALAQIPHHRTNPDFSIEGHVKKEYERNKEFANSDDELYQDIYNRLYIDLVSNMTGIDFVFSLQNPTIREQLLKPFFAELDLLAEYCVAATNPNFMKWFIDGLYGYKMTPELRDLSAQYLADNYSELKPIVEARRSVFDARKAVNLSL